MEIMTIGDVLDYIDEYAKEMNPKKNKKVKASQKDFDNF